MAWDEPFPVETGDTITKALWNKDVVSNTLALQGEDQRLANILADHDQHFDKVDASIIALAQRPVFTAGYTHSGSTVDGARWDFTEHHTGCPARVGDIIEVVTQWNHEPSGNILNARLQVYGSWRPISQSYGRTWYFDGSSHGTYGSTTSYFVVGVNDVQGSGLVHLSVLMNNGGHSSYDTFTCHGWINHGQHVVHTPKDYDGEYGENGLPLAAPEIADV